MKKNLLGIVLCPVSIISIVGVGFSGWKLNSSTSIEAELKVAEVEDKTSTGETHEVEIFSVYNNEPLKVFNFSSYGFDIDGEYKKTGGVVSSAFSLLTSDENFKNAFGNNPIIEVTATLKGVSGTKSPYTPLSLEHVASVSTTWKKIVNDGEAVFSSTEVDAISDSKVTDNNGTEDDTNDDFAVCLSKCTFNNVASRIDFRVYFTLTINDANYSAFYTRFSATNTKFQINLSARGL